MIEVVNLLGNSVSLIVHLGDTVSDFRRLTSRFCDIPYVSIKGNNDFLEYESKEEELYNLEGVKCFFTHGHKYGVKSDLLRLKLKAKEVGADVVLFGHTHIPYRTKSCGALFLNPGTIGISSYGVSTFAVLELDKGVLLSSEILTYNQISKQIDFWKEF